MQMMYNNVVEKDKLLDLMDRCYSKVAKEGFNGKEATIFIYGAVFGMETESIEVEVDGNLDL